MDSDTTWPSSLDRIDELCDMGDYEAADRILVEWIGPTVEHNGRTYDTAAMLRGELVEVDVGDLEIGRMKTRGWLAASYDGALPETED